MTEDIMPFGKYKDRPLLDVLNDGKYVQWLICQPWFRDRYENLYVLITQGAQDADTPTPEHNALQARFADQTYSTRVWAAAYNVNAANVPEGFDSWSAALKAIDAMPTPRLPDGYTVNYAAEQDLQNLAKRVARQATLARGVSRDFEQYGWDVVLEMHGYEALSIELKPSIGDEYPAIVRTLNKRRSRFGLAAVAFDRWVSVQPLSVVRSMFPEYVWLDLSAL